MSIICLSRRQCQITDHVVAKNVVQQLVSSGDLLYLKKSIVLSKGTCNLFFAKVFCYYFESFLLI